MASSTTAVSQRRVVAGAVAPRPAEALASTITEPGHSPDNLDNPNHGAGMTFLGQFPDHDTTFDRDTSRTGHATRSIPSGQEIARATGISPVLRSQDFPELRQFGHGMPSSTPLWYFVPEQAEVLAGGLRLDEVFIGLLQLDPTAHLAVDPDWRPTPPRRPGPAGDIRTVDPLTFARVDPTSRGQ